MRFDDALPRIVAPSSLLAINVRGKIKTQGLASLLASLPRLQSLELEGTYESSERGVLTLPVTSTCLRYRMLL